MKKLAQLKYWGKPARTYPYQRPHRKNLSSKTRRNKILAEIESQGVQSPLEGVGGSVYFSCPHTCSSLPASYLSGSPSTLMNPGTATIGWLRTSWEQRIRLLAHVRPLPPTTDSRWDGRCHIPNTHTGHLHPAGEVTAFQSPCHWNPHEHSLTPTWIVTTTKNPLGLWQPQRNRETQKSTSIPGVMNHTAGCPKGTWKSYKRILRQRKVEHTLSCTQES